MRTPREWISRFWGTLRGVRRDADLEEELRLHMELADEAAQRRGESPRAGRLRAGGISQAMDALRDQRGLPWLETLASDFVFGWRQLKKHPSATGAILLSLAMSIGATMAAFRLVDAVLLRPLPVPDPDSLFAVATTFVDTDDQLDYDDYFDYPTYRKYSSALGTRADVMVVGGTARQPIVFGTHDEPEVVFRQFVSGNVFPSLGLRPAAGRLLGPADDRTPGAHPVAVLSHDYWTRRFGGDPAVVGRTFRAGNQPYDVVGVAPDGFTGTEPGTVTDIFIPAMMNAEAIDSTGWSWFRMWVRPKGGTSAAQIRERLQVTFRADHLERLKSFPSDTPKARIDAFLREEVLLLPAGSGVSSVQKTFRRPLIILAALAGLVLLIACVNVANLLIAQAVARTREMALRISIGAARWRLIRLVLTESALLAVAASALGALFAWWSAPFVVSMLASGDRPVRLVLDVDWRALTFGVALAMIVTALFGIAPALRASSVNPLAALKGSDDPHAQRRTTNVLVAAQMAFCVFLLFAAGLFLATFDRLLNQPLGFSPHNVLLLQTEGRTNQSADVWAYVGDHLRRTPGVVTVAMAGWTPLSGNRWRAAVGVPGRPLQPNSPYFVGVSRGYFDAMQIGMVDGRDFRRGDAPPKMVERQASPGVGIVNEAFARVYFDGRSPVGARVSMRQNKEFDAPLEIVGLVRDAVYDNLREPMRPTVYVPVESRDSGALIVRTAGDPRSLAGVLRREVSRARPDLRVRAVEPLSAFISQQMIRERLLAALSTFFALVALLLAGVGLSGVLHNAVARQHHQIGIRMALGARHAQVVASVTLRIFAVVAAGAAIGLATGFSFGRVVQSLLFQVKPTDPAALTAPIVALGAAAVLAALPAAIRAVRIDPAKTLRTE